ncbi:synembryn-A [Leptidea sinapis]|uniref:synembryn-A n=1 Tax=Leptidea sinapis TaxID=189913 RepID=UPI002144CF71|nr:synembryn-A [Leptidea sinapis]
MEDSDICIVSGKEYERVLNVLQIFLRKNENTFTFPSLMENNRRITLWAALFDKLQDESAKLVHFVCLATLRVLSRDKTDIDNLVCEKWIITLIDKAGLYISNDPEGTDALPSKEIAVESLKCLCNIAFNSEVARALCAHTNIAQGLINRSYKDIQYKDDIMLYDIKLLFILTALRQDIRVSLKSELCGMNHLLNCLNDVLMEKVPISSSPLDDTPAVTSQHVLNENRQAIVCEILKTQFNMLYHLGSEESVSPEDEAMYLKLMPLLTFLLRAETHEKSMELLSNVANLLTSIPAPFYKYLTPELIEGQTSKHIYDGRNMEALYTLLQLLQHRLAITTGTSNQYENLSPILTVLNKSSRNISYHRKYFRQIVLPPLRDVHSPPEKGNTLRNQLCRLLTSPITSVRDLVAEFLFILCKEKVGRMVKYTGFGNAAGHLAHKGLMSGGQGPVQYSSSSEDSDTEEYLEAQPNIDPVVGCTRPPRVNPFEGMTEEQKEYEAMKLVNLFDKMVSEGIVKPATIGPDGKPKPVDHVLEFRENAPNRPQS